MCYAPGATDGVCMYVQATDGRQSVSVRAAVRCPGRRTGAQSYIIEQLPNKENVSLATLLNACKEILGHMSGLCKFSHPGV